MWDWGNPVDRQLDNRIKRRCRLPRARPTTLTVSIWKRWYDCLLEIQSSQAHPPYYEGIWANCWSTTARNHRHNALPMRIRKNPSTKDAIHAIHRLAGKHREKHKILHAADKVTHELIWWASRSRRVFEEHVEWIKMFHHKAKSHFRCGIGIIKKLSVKTGVYSGLGLFLRLLPLSSSL